LHLLDRRRVLLHSMRLDRLKLRLTLHHPVPALDLRVLHLLVLGVLLLMLVLLELLLLLLL
jgi:hypothetical protein